MSINNPLINTNNKIKYIIGGTFVLLLVVIGYFFLSKGKTDQPSGTGGGGGVVCKYGVDKDGNCKKAPTCYDKIPTFECPDGRTLVCDPIIQDFRCRIDDCESDTNPYPYDFKCDPSKIKCDSQKRYYCDGDCQNGGILYNGNGICSCPKSFIGDKCECDTSVCKGGQMSSDCNKCTSCCNSNTSIDNKCNSYGDDCKQTCPPNYVYDPDSPNIDKCVCTSKCFKEETNEDGSKICVQLNTPDCCKNGTITNGKCVCNDGWIGVKCDIPICGENGKWDDTQKKCVCNTDSVGDNCEYSRNKLCSGNGTPYIFNGVASCICDSGFSGAHCSCKDKDKPAELDLYKCKGINFKCEETSNGDGTYSGSWKENQLSCSGIFSQYGKEDGQLQWEKQCTKQLFSNYNYPDYYATCVNNVDGTASFNISSKTCNSTPTEDDLKNCNTDDCYVSWKHKYDQNKTYTSSCICDNTDNGTVYSCKPNQNNSCSGTPPDSEIFCSGGNVDCILCGGNKFTYSCESRPLPKECVIYRKNLKTNTTDDNTVWYNNQDNPIKPIFPVVDKDTCNYDTILDNNYLQWSSLSDKNSVAGFVKGLNYPGTPTPTFYPYDHPNILSYNINADIVQNPNPKNTPTTISLQSNAYPFNNSGGGQADKDLFFNDSSNQYRYQAGCARFKDDEKTKFDKNNPENNNDYTSCALGIDGEEAGSFKQYCADENNNILPDCSDKPYYRTDKGYCKCNKYKSNAQPDKDKVEYQGRYCQYNDNDNCSGQGIVDYSGDCDCNKSLVKYCSQAQKTFVNYTGKNCNLDDNTVCKGLGGVYYNMNVNGPSCDFSILEDVTLYNITPTINDGDIIIIEYVKADLPVSSDGLTLTPTGLFVGGGMGGVKYAISTPDVFIVKKIGEGKYAFSLVDLKTNSPMDLDSSYYLTSDDNSTTIYQQEIHPYYVDNYSDKINDIFSIFNTTSNMGLECNPYNNYKLEHNTRLLPQSLWKFHKFNVPLNPTTCSL